MCEVWEEATYVKHHKKKIAFLFSAMRHFARQLKEQGHRLLYLELTDKKNSISLKSAVKFALAQYIVDRIVITHPGEHRLLTEIENWESTFGIPVQIRPDDRFLCSLKEFAHWAKGKKKLRMEYFYRDMRKKHSILMEGGNPLGGQWNYDSENRAPPKEGLTIPIPYKNKPDQITRDVLELVAGRFDTHFGDLEPFNFAVTRDQALIALNQFINQRLTNFGHYQDAMLQDEPWMYHAHISFYLNIGLLGPLECAKAAEDAYLRKEVPLNAAEGFIRQIIGWREYIRGIYWLKMPEYAETNYLNARRNLPKFYWTANTNLNCLHQCIVETQENAYAHHIQRLMVLGNFALIAGIDPAKVNEWFLTVYADAYEWAELPNVSGMILFADGGFLASKPYAASGSYINKMSNYCKNCSYKVSKKTGAEACPFNYLFWNFLIRNRDKLEANPRVRMMYKTYDRMDSSKKKSNYE